METGGERVLKEVCVFRETDFIPRHETKLTPEIE